MLLLLGKGGLLSIQHSFRLAVLILNGIIHAYIPEVQGILQNLIGTDIIRSIGIPCRNIIYADTALACDVPDCGIGRILHMDVTLEVGRRVLQLVHELLDIGFVYPCGTQPHLNFRSFQVFGLGSPEGFHIALIHRVLRGGIFRFFQLSPHIAGEIFVSRDPSGMIFQRAQLGIVEDDASQIGGQLVYGFPGQAGHVPQVYTGPFPNGDRQSFHSGVHRGSDLMGLNSALAEHIRLALKVSIVVQNFQSAQEIVGGIIREGQPVSTTVENTVLFRKAVIEGIQICLLLLNGTVRGVFIHL